MAKKLIAGVAGLLVPLLALTGCGATATPSSEPSTAEQVSGTVKVLTNRTDLVQDGTFDKYAAEFKKLYPDVTVSFEGITDYAGQVAIRLNTKDYGDVLAIPSSVKESQLSTFFEPLGAQADLEKTFRFTAEHAADGQVYGLATGGNANGVVYNKKVFAAAGITTLPKTPEEFLTDLQLIKDKTDAIPLYTNYKDGWPLSQWFGNLGSASGSADANTLLSDDDAPWTQGKDMYAIDSLLFDAVNKKLTEDDPLTTNWEKSKNLIGTGKVATMVLGSWAISQMQAAAKTAGGSADDIGYMAFPVTAADGKQYAVDGGDYAFAVNVNSSVKPAAKAFVNWFVTKSGYAADQGMISADRSVALPSNLKDLTDNNVELLELAQNPTRDELINESQIDLTGNTYRQKLVDIARGAAKGDMASYFTELNTKWAKARVAIG
ncbi:MAG: ABC transporter substrate-binding protein [Actinobacteria bacterium]|nr:ABC transporter substrate-binding protein [Actinomycetota bacterium]